MKTFKQFQEGVAALKGGSKLIPALVTSIGAAGTLFKAQEYIKKKFRPKEEEKPKDDYYDGGEEQERIEKEIQKKMKDKQDTEKANKKQLKKINNPKDKKDPFSGSGKVVDAETLKRMNAPENQFNSYNPLGEEAPIVNNVGDGNIAGTAEAGDDPPVNKKKKKGQPTIIARGCMPGARGRFKGGVELLASFKKNKYT